MPRLTFQFKNHLHKYRLGQFASAGAYMRKFCEPTAWHPESKLFPLILLHFHILYFLSGAFFSLTLHSMFLASSCLSSRAHSTPQVFPKAFPDLISIRYLIHAGNFPPESQSHLCLPWSQPLSPHVTIAPVHTHLAQSPFQTAIVLFILYPPFLAHGLAADAQ